MPVIVRPSAMEPHVRPASDLVPSAIHGRVYEVLGLVSVFARDGGEEHLARRARRREVADASGDLHDDEHRDGGPASSAANPTTLTAAGRRASPSRLAIP